MLGQYYEFVPDFLCSAWGSDLMYSPIQVEMVVLRMMSPLTPASSPRWRWVSLWIKYLWAQGVDCATRGQQEKRPSPLQDTLDALDAQEGMHKGEMLEGENSKSTVDGLKWHLISISLD